MTIPSRGTPEFWRLYRALPADARFLAWKSYRFWSAHAFHPSLHFKPTGKPNWSARVSGHYRAVGKFSARGSLTGEPLITDPLELTAAYLFYLCRNHPFVDGNKRAALATRLVFSRENGLLPDEELDADGWERLTLDVAAGRLDRSQTMARLRKLI